MERWADIQGHPGYRVSDHGKVEGPNGPRKATKQTTGYYYVGWKVEGKLTNFLVHRLVADAFCPCDDKRGLIVAHRDGNKDNCRWDNLKWTTQLDNMADKKLHETAHNTPRGEGHSRCKVTEVQVLEIREKAANGQSINSLSKEYGLSYTPTDCIVKRRTWKHI